MKNQAFSRIRIALDKAPRNAYVAELHVQVIKHAEEFETLSGKEFCAGIGVSESFGTEFLKMRKIAKRLRDAGLDVEKL
ncbi:MAG: hypothetical protein KDJ20_17315 [Hyphomicrobiales bacterium]|nr:hypothetical protein [Hyphomicrobiales bacterium]MCC2105653.1 hypothetical protein [Hyphomicrobiales bacterium]MCC2107773.1 hypothetical protein [Hyphomicrobiales bacterium]